MARFILFLVLVIFCTHVYQITFTIKKIHKIRRLYRYKEENLLKVLIYNLLQIPIVIRFI